MVFEISLKGSWKNSFFFSAKGDPFKQGYDPFIVRLSGMVFEISLKGSNHCLSRDVMLK
ncbi:hypothetical protein QYM36_011269 [Artemia franciscana]|uniref:Uncharacterized protein n=1 Tax=Artemia franciscana TaxID=6661 RepID=A0AA88HX12_ARTSF|nr:hypothetical protein QYM36_011269 [Artemia franciscana]KAK2712518.1 hypothetical protein QYM36_011269 [Artemia franciscana]